MKFSKLNLIETFSYAAFFLTTANQDPHVTVHVPRCTWRKVVRDCLLEAVMIVRTRRPETIPWLPCLLQPAAWHYGSAPIFEFDDLPHLCHLSMRWMKENKKSLCFECEKEALEIYLAYISVIVVIYNIVCMLQDQQWSQLITVSEIFGLLSPLRL